MATVEQQGPAKTISSRRPCLVSFSGVDGSGKTTQIEALLAWLRDAGLRVHVLRFWNDIAVFGRMRETMSHTLFKSEKGIGSPDRPVERRHKNVRAWYMTAARLGLYFLDAARLAVALATPTRRRAEGGMFDR